MEVTVSLGSPFSLLCPSRERWQEDGHIQGKELLFEVT